MHVYNLHGGLHGGLQLVYCPADWTHFGSLLESTPYPHRTNVLSTYFDGNNPLRVPMGRPGKVKYTPNSRQPIHTRLKTLIW